MTSVLRRIVAERLDKEIKLKNMDIWRNERHAQRTEQGDDSAAS
jgi:hypothetical protein